MEQGPDGTGNVFVLSSAAWRPQRPAGAPTGGALDQVGRWPTWELTITGSGGGSTPTGLFAKKVVAHLQKLMSADLWLAGASSTG